MSRETLDFDPSTPTRPDLAEGGSPGRAVMLRAAHLGAVPGVLHGFTTRTRAADDPEASALHLARRPGVDPRALTASWEAVARGLHPALGADRVALLHQVHGARVVRAGTPSGPLNVLDEADAVYTDVPGLVLAIRTADCVPVLLAGRRYVGAAHSGWRGTAVGVVPALVRRLRAEGEAPDDLVAAIGPAISGEAYEVGPEVVDGLRRAGLPDDDFLIAPNHVDLQRAVGAQLRRLGVPTVEVLRCCTFHDARLHSHRRDGAASGRQAAVIARCP